MEPAPTAPLIALLDYGMGNLRSVARALEAGGARVRLAARPEDLAGAAGMVFPGQGALPDCARRLRETGLDNAVRAWVAAGRPYLGVCLGLQVLFEHSEEGPTEGLGILRGEVRRFRLPEALKIPHMGWNRVGFAGASPLTEGLPPHGTDFYFVHSYHAVPADPADAWGEADYDGPFCAAARRGNVFAVQFHPEKSQAAGLLFYRNFVRLCGSGE